MAIDPNIKKKADDIRNKIYGKEVRESLASGLEAMSEDVVEYTGRQDNVESQFQDVIENTTDKDVISAPEIIAARNGEPNLKSRLDKEKQEVTAQLAQTATKNELADTNSNLYAFSENKVDKNGSAQVTYANLSQEVREQFTGGNTAVVGDDSIINSNITNKAVDRRTLADNYSSKGQLASDANLNSVLEEGTYYFSRSTTNGLPSGFVAAVGILEVIQASNRWTIQRITPTNIQTAVYHTWYRTIDGGNGNYNEWQMTNSGTGLDKGDAFSGSNIDQLTAIGHYTVNPTTAGTFPENWGGRSGQLTVSLSSGRWVVQELTDLFDGAIRYIRTIDKQSGTIRPWNKVQIGSLEVSFKSHLDGKTLVCLGDSLTEFGNYPEIIEQRTGMTVYNVGFGGTRLAKHGSANYDKFSISQLVKAIVSGDWTHQDEAAAAIGGTFPEILERLKSIDFNEVDYITILSGTNDWAGTISHGSVTLGSPTDTTRDTFYGAIPEIVRVLSTAYPHLKLSFITPIYRSRTSPGDGRDSDNYDNHSGNMMIEFVDAIKIQSEKEHVPYLDLYRRSGINSYNADYFLDDGVHLTSVGYELVGNEIASYLLSTY